MKNIETKIAKNGTMIIKINGKRVSRQVAVDSLFEDSVGTTISNDQGHIFTCISNNEPTPAGFGQRVGYLLTDENGKSYIFNFMSEALNCIGNNYFPNCNIVGEKETPDFGDKRFSVTIYYEIQEADGKLIKNEYAHFATATAAANHIIAFVAAHPDYIYQDGKIADWNTDNDYRITADDMKAATFDTNEDTAGNVEISEDVIEVKNGANGNVMFYLNGNRAKEADLVKAAIDKDQPYYRALAQKRGESKCVEEFFLSTITAYKWLCRMARKNAGYAEGYMAISLEKVMHTPTCTTLTGDDIYTNKMPVEDIADKHLKDYIKQQADAEKIVDDTGNDTDETAAADTTRPLVDAYYFDGGRWVLVTLEQEIVNHETLLFGKDDLLIIKGHHGAKIMFLPNGGIAFFLQPFDPDTHRYIDDFDRVDEDDFWLEMTERGLCTLDPVNNELIAAEYEFANNYNEFDKDCRRFLVNGEIITFSRDRWLEIYSPKICAKISRAMYLNTIRYDVDQWNGSDNCRVNFELPRYNVSVAEFWWSMYRRGFIQRAMPFRITIEHDDAPASVYDVADLEISYMRNGDNYDVFIDGDKKIILATLETNRMQAFADKIHAAFVTSAGVTIDTKGAVTVIADEDIYTLDACAEINRHAPEGWTITFDTQGKFFPVKFNGKKVATLDSLATQKFLSPEKFFDQFKPLVDKTFTPKQQFLADRYNELATLEEMREEIADDAEQLQTLEEMIEQVKRDIAAEELAG